ncbi:MAG: peptidyl-prolyl cis-trans isomerase [Candidatus Aminicenantes bacterium]|nr:peptidyl-prolyl cis-trans isomerase [Candidatus Aminicenantes bacterium]
MRFFKACLAALLLLGPAALQPAQKVVEEIVAVVNDEIITLSAFKAEYDARIREAEARYRGEELEKALAFVKTNTLEELITDKLLLQMARSMNLNVTDRVKTIVDNIIKENDFTNEEEFKRALAQQGFQYDAWIKMMEDRVMKETVVGMEIGRKIVIEDAEIVDYHRKHKDEFIVPEEYTLKAVYLAIGDKEPAALEAKKAEIDAKLKDGTLFDEIAEADSDEPMKEAKGNLGTFKKAELDKTLLAAVEPLKKGDTTSWVQTKNGWYLLRLEDKKDSRVLEFEEARAQITEKIGLEKQNAELAKFLSDLKTKNYIKILKPNPLDDK